MAQAPKKDPLLLDIEAFMSRTGFSPSYFGVQSCGNPRLLPRLRSGGDVTRKTETKIREFMDSWPDGKRIRKWERQPQSAA